MTNMLERIAEAMTTYFVYPVGHIDSKKWQIHDGSSVSTEFDSEMEAHDACKRMNARAVLEVLVEHIKRDGLLRLLGAEVWYATDGRDTEKMGAAVIAMLTEAMGGE